MSNQALDVQFNQDCVHFLDTLNALFLSCEGGNVSDDSLAEAFRCFHSIKSEAAYLEYDEIRDLSHRGEEILAAVRNKEKALLGSDLDSLFSITSGIEKILRHDAADTTGYPKREGKKTPAQYLPLSEGYGFTPMEQELLSEARDRNELFYRVVCCFISDLQMKYPRSFLIMNRLEQLVTVIKTSPDLYENKDDFDRLTIYFTSAVEESAIRENFDIDGIESVFVTVIPWRIVFGEKDIQSIMSVQNSQYRNVHVPVEKIDIMLGDIHSLKMMVFSRLPELKDELKRIESSVKNLRLVRLDDEFNRYVVFVRNTARDFQKHVRLERTGGDITIDKNLIEQLADPIMHLVRNAMVHGIELPADRIKAGKNEIGTITLAAEKQGKGIILQVRDDGRGIDEEYIRSLARQSGLFGTPVEDLSLVELLSAQGFSTAPDVSNYAGRGIGLDVVSRKIHTIPGAEFTVANTRGEGVCFSITIPHAVSLVGVHLFLYCGQIFGMYEDGIGAPYAADAGMFSKGEDKGVCYSGKPVYTILGRLYMMDSYPSKGLMIPFIRDGEEVVLYADEDISLEDLPQDQFQIAQTPVPNMHDIFIAGRKVPYSLFIP